MPHGLLFSIYLQGYFYMHHPTYRIIHTTAFITPVVGHWLEWEIAQWIHHQGSIRWPTTPQANTLTTELHLVPRDEHYRIDLSWISHQQDTYITWLQLWPIFNTVCKPAVIFNWIVRSSISSNNDSKVREGIINSEAGKIRKMCLS